MTFSRPEFDSWLDSGALLGVSRDHVLIAWGPSSWEPHPKKDESPSFYAPDFFLNTDAPWLHFKSQAWVKTEELLDALATHFNFCEPLPALTWLSADPTPFHQAFEGLQAEIRAGHLAKGVPYLRETAQGDVRGARLLHCLQSMLEYSQSRPVYPYGFWGVGRNPAEGILGCTPELLFRQLPGEIVQTMALAGTRRTEDHHLPSLLEDPKERKEHQWVIDSIASDLARMGRVEIGPTGVAQLPHLSHLKTSIELKTEHTIDFEVLVQTLHPTPALGAFPKEPGWKWLKQLEHLHATPRRRFGAPFGAQWKNETGQTESVAAVAIRNIQWQGSQIELFAGCGVIAESQEAREWNELLGKVRAVKAIFGI